MQVDMDLESGQLICLTSLTTNKYVQYNHSTKQLDANGKNQSHWEVLRGSQRTTNTSTIQLRHATTKLFINVANDFIVDLSKQGDVSCDLKIIKHSMNSCVSFEFAAYPNCFVGFTQSGEPKTATMASKVDMFSVDILPNLSQSPTQSLSSSSGSGIKSQDPKLNAKNPIFHPLPPPRLATNEKFDAICTRRAEEFNQYFREIEVNC